MWNGAKGNPHLSHQQGLEVVGTARNGSWSSGGPRGHQGKPWKEREDQGKAEKPG